MTLEEVIELWKEKGVDKCVFTFDCGGDSMNETDCKVYDIDGKDLGLQEIVEFIDEQIYDEVEFYVNSDGHYQGESGQVIITLVEEDDTEPDLEYYKDALSTFNESYSFELEIDLTQDELSFVEKFVRRVLGGTEEQRFLYKKDCILSDDDTEIQEDLLVKITDICGGYVNTDIDGEVQEWFNFTTEQNDGTELTIQDGKLKVILNQTYEETRQQD